MSIFSFLKRGVKGAVGGFLTGGPAGAIAGGVGSAVIGGLPSPGRGFTGQPGQNPTVPGRCPTGFRLGSRGTCEPVYTTMPVTGPPQFGGPPGGGQGGCPPGTVWDPQGGFCASPKSPVGKKHLADQFGEAVMGRYGAALQPGTRTTSTAVCPRGTVLGKDGLCYNKRDLKKDERMWPPGTKPLLTGGDVRAIRIASRAAGKLERKTKQLQKMGMLKKPTRAAPRRKALPAGHHSHVHHD